MKTAAGLFSKNLSDIFKLRSLWMVICFSLSVFFVSKQWGDMDSMLIPFLERYYGEDTPAVSTLRLKFSGKIDLNRPCVGPF